MGLMTRRNLDVGTYVVLSIPNLTYGVFLNNFTIGSHVEFKLE